MNERRLVKQSVDVMHVDLIHVDEMHVELMQVSEVFYRCTFSNFFEA